ncbi:MAG TPA: GNAT family N-acetyltransferase [Oculatellaceae cyanobacterium]
MKYSIRAMTRGDLELAIDWAAAEGWNPGLNDADTFFSTDPNGYFLGDLDGEAVSSISAVSYGQTYGFVGFYIVKPSHRGHGFGYRLWQAGLKHLEGRNIGLDGVPQQEENYRKSGFKTAYSNIRYELTSTDLSRDQNNVHARHGVCTIEYDAAKNDQIVEFDTKFFPVRRAMFLQHWLKQPGSMVRVSLSEGSVVGYGVIRPCRNGFKIGPLFAETETIADALFRDLARIASGQPVFLDAPESNNDATALVKRYNMQPMFATSRMYTQAAPELPLAKIYGVTTFELG